MTQEVWGCDLLLLSGLLQERHCFGSFSQLRLLQENWIRTGFYCKLSHHWAAQTLCPPRPSASLRQLITSPGAAGEEGVLPGLWAPVLSRKESVYWK